MVDEFGENELRNPAEDIKASSRKKTTVVVTGLIVFFLTLSVVGFYAYQNSLFGNLFNVKSTKHISTEGETSMAEENLIQETILESENLESTNN